MTNQARLIDQTYLPRDKAATTGTSATLFTNCSYAIKLRARSLSILPPRLIGRKQSELAPAEEREGQFRQLLTILKGEEGNMAPIFILLNNLVNNLVNASY
jgi:hypothetical protein